MNNKKINIKIISAICIILCIFVVIVFNLIIKQVKKDTNNIITEISSEEKTIVIKENNSIDIPENESNNKILDNFADTKSTNIEVLTVTKVEKKMKVTAKELNVRSEALSLDDDNIIGILKKGDIVNVTGICDNDWVEISYEGKVAYTYGEYLEDIK